ncbi:MAG: SCO family protein [Pseudomonadota bacterium]
MRLIPPISFLCLLAALLMAPAAVAVTGHDAGMHNPPAAPAGSPASKFDEKAALALSQGVIGKPVGDYTLTATDGSKRRLSEYRGKPLVISLIYTSCYHICPTTTQHLDKVTRIARAALGPESFSVLTIGFDTPKDTPVAMRQFARDQGIDMPGWQFLSADATTMQGLTKDLGFISYAAPHGFDHLIQATVIDAQGKIYRQVYGMTFDTPLLVEPLKELVFGEPVTPSLLSSLSNKVKLFCTVYDPTSGKYRFDYSIFLGLLIGASSIGIVAFLVLREWRRTRRRRQGLT